MNKHHFILASASPRRQALLVDIGLTPDQIIPADLDETPHKGERPRCLAVRLAFAKGAMVAGDYPGAFVLSADTVVACGRRVLPKAETAQDVAAFLALLSGRRHSVFTAVALHLPEGRVLTALSHSRVSFARLSKTDIDRYAANGEGVGKAGGYAIQGQASRFIRCMAGSYSGIVGLPLFETSQLLKQAGFRNEQ